MARVTLTPLTKEEQQFAAEHHSLVDRYLHSRRLPAEDWYDAVILSYLQAVKKWFARPELQQYRFSTIAYNAMRGAIGNERNKQSRRIQAVSLEEVMPGTEERTYSDTVTYEHLRYIPYGTYGDEDMKIQYDVELPERTRACGRKKSEEAIAIEEFLAGSRTNMRLEYESREEAKKKYASIRTNWRRKGHQELYDVFREENCIYMVRLKGLKEKKQQILHADKEKAPAGIGVPDAGAQQSKQLQDKPNRVVCQMEERI